MCIGVQSPIYTLIHKGDFAFYQTLLQIMIPEVLRPIPPPSLTQVIQNFAKSLECLRITAMADCPTVRLITVEKASLTIQPFQEITTIKLSTVWSFSQTLLRYTSLNHLTQAAGRPQQSGLPHNVPSHKFD